MPGYIAESDNYSIHRRFTSVHISGSKVAEWAKRLDKVICHVLSRTEGIGSNLATRQKSKYNILLIFLSFFTLGTPIVMKQLF